MPRSAYSHASKCLGKYLGGLSLALLLTACEGGEEAPPSPAAAGPANVDQARLEKAVDEPRNWMTYGGTYAETRFSPLKQITTDNIGDLELAWSYELDTKRGQEATPLVVDGVMYTSTAWSKVFAFDAATGELLWSHDPEVPGGKGVHACCDVVNRGVAVWKGKVFVGTIDGRLIALDAETGEEVWSVVTVDQQKPYTITMAPRAFKDKVVIGNSGAELGVRGYVTAYDTETGDLVWRFYTVPGNPAEGPDGAASDKALADLALPTWNGEWWKYGGGGTVWDSVVYDPELDQLYIGVGNGSPWNHRIRSDGEGDNLFLSSIVAVDPDTGQYLWHYQANPGETWDFTNTQQMTLATLTIDGEPRKVIMQAPKNGFFYILDRTNGELLSAENFVPVNWATGIDMETGRPMEVEGARYEDKPFFGVPSGIGAHAWQPMSYSLDTGLVYIPAMEVPLSYGNADPFVFRPGRWNTGVSFLAPPPGPGLPEDPNARQRAVRAMSKGHLLAWDPIGQEEVWRHQYDEPWNGGILSTAGNLLFQGNPKGEFQAFDAKTGDKLWSYQTHRAVMAGPMTYEVGGEQYVAVMAGLGGSMGIATEPRVTPPETPYGLVLAFKLNGGGGELDYDPVPRPPANPPGETFPPDMVAEGQGHYLTFCALCHRGAILTDLRRSAALTEPELWRSIVIDGAFEEIGMASFADYLRPHEAESIRAYVGKLARDLQAEEQARAE